MREVLGLGHHLVIPSDKLTDHPVDGVVERWLPPTASSSEVRQLLYDLDGVLFLERPNWHPDLLRLARQMGVLAVCVPNWEWFNAYDARWKYCNFFVCPTQWTLKILHSYGFYNSAYLPCPVSLKQFPSRRISGPARHFIHNAGLVDQDDRKGTRDTILAFCRMKRKDVRLTVRLQKESDLPPFDGRVDILIGNLLDPSDLYDTGDICVQPSKMEGIGFMVLEPICVGMPVITTDYPPMNEFVQQPELRCSTHLRKRKAFPTNWISHAHLKIPSIRDLVRKMDWAASNDLAAISQANRFWAERTYDPLIIRRSWELLLSQIPRAC